MAYPKNYRPEIDGLRSVAIVAVLAYHLGEVFLSVNVLSGGFLGVDIFFVISGYLISNIILSDLEGGCFRCTDFYYRRVRRIIPAFLLVIIASLPFAWWLLMPQEMQDFSRSILFSIFFVSNLWFFSSDPYWMDSLIRPFLHTWSLSVEEQFYLVFPSILIVVTRYIRRWMLHFFIFVFLVSIVYAQFQSADDTQAAFFLLPSRLWEFAVGILLVVIERHRLWQPLNNLRRAQFLCGLGMIMMIFPLFFYSSDTRHPSFLTLIPVLGVALTIAYANEGSWVTRFLQQKPLVGLGLISYSLYLWHYPLFVFAAALIETPSTLKAILLCVLCVVVSIISFILVEQPARNFRAVPFRRLSVLLLAVLLSLIPALLYISKDGLRNRYPAFLLSQELMPEIIKNYQWFHTENAKVGNLILVGDSHMMAVAPKLKELALQRGFDFSVSNERGCQLIIDVRRVFRSSQKPTHCKEELQKERLAFLESLPPSYVVLGGRLPLVLEEAGFDNKMGGKEKRMIHYFQNPESSLSDIHNRRAYIRDKYHETVEVILSMGHVVVLLYPIPEAGWDIPKTLIQMVDGDWINARKIVQNQPLETSYGVFKSRTKRAYELLDEIDNESILRVYPEKLFCNITSLKTCLTHDENYVFYRDTHHPSSHGSSMIATVIMEVILKGG